MSAAHSATISLPRPVSSPRRSPTWVVAAAATAIGTLAIAALMSLSIVLAGPLPSTGAEPVPQPIPRPTATAGLDR